uniref:Syntaxin N-terminal domain-containing protein n=1 Tax=Ananas comosus var. bracteatus TaxID=296719 RepID=A0A6V7PS06_ANACO|nr:unnamed protein product [Ananas comosus var. bracteatus]
MNNLMTKSFLDYVELKKQAMVIEGSGASLEASADLEARGLTSAEEANLALFFSEVGAIQSAMDAISALLSDLRLLHSESRSAHSPKLLGGLRDHVDSGLEALDDSNAANRALSPRFAAGTSVDRTRVSITHGIRANLRDAILSDHKETLKQNYYNATGELASNKVLDEMLKWSGDPMDPPWSSPGAAAPSASVSTSPPPRTSSRATSKTPPPTLSPPWLRAASPSPAPSPDSPSPPGSRSPSPATYSAGRDAKFVNTSTELHRAPLSASAELHRAPLSAAASPPSSAERLRVSTEAAASPPRLHRSRRISAASLPSSTASPSTYLHPLHLFDEIPKRNKTGGKSRSTLTRSRRG